MKRLLSLCTPFVFALLLIGPASTVSADNPLNTCAYFSDSGHNVHGSFWAYYAAHNGAGNFGAPLTEAFLENGYVVQYFQKARFEFRPDYPEPYRVQLGLLGVTYGITDPPVQSIVIPRADDPNYAYFPATGLWVPYQIKRYFDAHGGWELFGYPISNVRYETQYFTQYFQRARLEWYPLENRVVASPVGQIALDKQYSADFKWRTRTANDWCPDSNAVNSVPALPGSTFTPAALPTTIPQGIGMGLQVRVRFRQAGPNGPQYVDVFVYDSSSRPISGVALIGTVHFVSGARVFPLLASDATGRAAFSFEIGNQPPNTPTLVEVVAYSGSQTMVGRDSFTR